MPLASPPFPGCRSKFLWIVTDFCLNLQQFDSRLRLGKLAGLEKDVRRGCLFAPMRVHGIDCIPNCMLSRFNCGVANDCGMRTVWRKRSCAHDEESGQEAEKKAFHLEMAIITEKYHFNLVTWLLLDVVLVVKLRLGFVSSLVKEYCIVFTMHKLKKKI